MVANALKILGELPKVEHKEMQTVPAERLGAFLEEAKRSGVYELYYIELATGLRRGELLGLKWTDIAWKNGIIKVRRQVSRVDGKILVLFQLTILPQSFPESLEIILILNKPIKILASLCYNISG